MGYTPNADAIAEFNMITQNASAEFGNFEGGIINTTSSRAPTNITAMCSNSSATMC